MKLNNDNLNSDELARFFLTESQKLIEQANDNDYVINQAQANTFLKVVNYFQKLARKDLGEWVKAKVDSPKKRYGSITINLWGISFLDVKDTQEFSKIISYASSVDISPLTTGFLEICLTIPNIFVEKTKKEGDIKAKKYEDFNSIKQKTTSILEKILADRKGFVINQKQVGLFVGIHEFLLNLTDDDEEFGEWVLANINNMENGSGNIMAQMVYAHFTPEKMTEFYLMLSASKATFSIFAMDEAFFKIIVDVPDIIVPQD